MQVFFGHAAMVIGGIVFSITTTTIRIDIVAVFRHATLATCWIVVCCTITGLPSIVVHHATMAICALSLATLPWK
jgi:hypothetical protein